MGLKYPYTCDEIDREIGRARGELISSMNDIFKTYGVNASMNDAFQAGEELYSCLSEVFEGARKSNENIREAANNQIKNLEDEIIELRALLHIANNAKKDK